VTYVSLVIVVLVLFAVMTYTRRSRQRAVEQHQSQRQQLDQIRFGTDVMTTSGLFGTVVGLNDDETVQLSIAPGVEVKWALAALEDVASLPSRTVKDSTTDDETGESDGSREPPSS
jgi:preprotein translocase subunit YajC